MTVPFSIDRDSSISLVEQVCTGIKQAITSGFYPVGTAVPSLKVMAEALGVSIKVPVTAYKRLVSDGWLTAVSSICYKAKSPDMPVWRGNVLVVQPMGGISYYQCAAVSEMQSALVDAGYLTTNWAIPEVGEMQPKTVALLRAALLRQYSMIVSFIENPEALDMFANHGCPVVVITYEREKYEASRKTRFLMTWESATEKIAEIATGMKIQTAELIAYQDEGFHGLGWFAGPLEKHGIKCTYCLAPIANEKPRFAAIKRGAQNAIRKRLALNRLLPDLFVFLDDYVASGALPVFAANGIRFPENARAVTIANKFLGPVYFRDLTRLESNPIDDGRKLASFVLARLAGDNDISGPILEPDFIRGETL